jgi:hypothetical protein
MVENRRNFFHSELSVFSTFDPTVSVFSEKSRNGTEYGTKVSESKRKQGRHFSAHIFGIPYLAGILPDFFWNFTGFQPGP